MFRSTIADNNFHRPTIWYFVQPYSIYAASHSSTLAIDIVKVRLQTTKKYTGAIDGATQIFKNEGPLAFYKVRGTNPALGRGCDGSARADGFHRVIGNADAFGGNWCLRKFNSS